MHLNLTSELLVRITHQMVEWVRHLDLFDDLSLFVFAHLKLYLISQNCNLLI